MKFSLRFFICTIPFAFATLTGLAQFKISGRVLSANKPVPFTNIGILNSAIGTISDEDGTFSLTIPPGHTRDSIIFSSIGFERKLVPVSALEVESQVTVRLKETVTKLNEVTINGLAIKEKTVRAGNKKHEGGAIFSDTVTAGSAMALLIHNPGFSGEQVFVKNTQVMITDNKFPQFKLRIRLLEVTTAGMPGGDLLKEEVIVRSSLENGYLKTDLSRYKAVVNGDFFLVYEWILDSKDRHLLFTQFDEFARLHPDKVAVDYGVIDKKRIPYLNFNGNFYAGTSFGVAVSPSALKNEVCYYRLNSFGKWYRSASILTAQVAITNNLQETPTIVAPDTKEKDEPTELFSYYSITKQNSAKTKPQTENDQVPWGSRVVEPVPIYVQRTGNHLAFRTRNNTPFCYQVTLKFSKIMNLEPVIDTLKALVPPGTKTLVSMAVVDPKIPNYHFELAARELIGNPDARPNYDFPYLIPIKSHHITKAVTLANSSEEKEGQFRSISPRDTVYAMRQGKVTALPVMDHVVDRVSASASLEALHADGTIMTYDNLDPSSVLVTVNALVSAGQPIGLVKNGQSITVRLFEITNNGMLKQLPILYLIYGNRTAHYNEIPSNLVVTHPDSIIALEK